MNLIKDIESLDHLMQKYFVKNTITNNYVLIAAYHHLIEDQKLYFTTSPSNLCILVKKADFYRLYYYINNQDELIDFENDSSVVMEILYRGETHKPTEIISYWEKCGFKPHLTRDNLIASYSQLIIPIDKPAYLEIKHAETEAEINFTKELIESTLDKYTGDILTYEEVSTFVKNRNVLCAYWAGKLSGILQFEIKNNMVWLGHIAVDSEFRGKGIAKELVKAYIQTNVSQPGTKYQLWVIQNNIGATALYYKFGFVYNNKSSASMIKN